jgi:hypothetical protein
MILQCNKTKRWIPVVTYLEGAITAKEVGWEECTINGKPLSEVKLHQSAALAALEGRGNE